MVSALLTLMTIAAPIPPNFYAGSTSLDLEFGGNGSLENQTLTFYLNFQRVDAGQADLIRLRIPK